MAGYDAFISYSHTTDAVLSPALQRALQRLARRPFQQRALRIFRDNANLSASPALWWSIQTALDQSRYFILLASPDAAASPYVNREVEYWLARKPAGTLLIALTDGDIVWSPHQSDFDWIRTTALPASLRGRLTQEPRWIDLRLTRRGALTLDVPAFRECVADLAAPLHGRPKDELIGEDVVQHRRTMRLLRMGVATTTALAVAAAVGAGVAVRQTSAANQARDVAEEQQRLAEEQERRAVSRRLVLESQNLFETDPGLSLQLGLAALRLDPSEEVHDSLASSLALTQYAGNLIRPGLVPAEAAPSPVGAVASSPDGRLLAAGRDDGSVLLWRTDESLRPTSVPVTLAAQPMVHSMAFSPDASLLAAGAGSTVSVWDLTDVDHPEHIQDLPVVVGGLVNAVAFLPDGTLVVGDSSTDVSLWSVGPDDRPQRASPPLSHVAPVYSVAVSPANTSLIAVGTADGALTLWNVSDHTDPGQIARLDIGMGVQLGGIAAVALNESGTLLAVTREDGHLSLWGVADPANPVQVGLLASHRSQLTSLAFGPGGLLAAPERNGSISIYHVADPADAHLWANLSGHHGEVRDIAFSAGGALVSASSDTTVVMWDLWRRTGPHMTGGPLVGHTARIWGLDVSSDGSMLVTGSDDGTVMLWDVVDRGRPSRIVGPLPVHDAPVAALQLLPDDRTLITADEGGIAKVWSLADPTDPLRLATMNTGGFPLSIDFTPASRTMAIATSDGIRLWDMTNPRQPRSLGRPLTEHDDAVWDVEFTPDGDVLISVGADGKIALWDVADRDRPQPIGDPVEFSVAAYVAALSGNGQRLAVGFRDGTLGMWDVSDPADPRQLGTLIRAHEGATIGLDFSPDGHTLASAGADGIFALWEVRDQAAPGLIAGLPNSAAQSFAVAYFPDGATVAVSSGDPAVALWSVSEVDAIRADPASRACALVAGFTPDEWLEHVGDVEFQPMCP